MTGSSPGLPAKLGVFQDQRPTFGQDPHLTPYGTEFLLIESQDEERITIKQLHNLENLAGHSTITIRDDPREHQLWSPELHFLPEYNRWFIFYAASDGNNETHRNYVLRSAGTSPLDEYEFLGQVRGPDRDGNQDHWGIDLTTFRHNGLRYAVWSSRAPGTEFPQNLYIALMPTPTQLSGRTLLSTPTYPWETSHAQINEGPQAYYTPNGTLLIFFCC